MDLLSECKGLMDAALRCFWKEPHMRLEGDPGEEEGILQRTVEDGGTYMSHSMEV
jgi:hypothetical protein